MRQLLSDIALIPDDHRRGETFERAVKWLLENAPETRNKFKKVWLWDDYPDREGRDLGIDLVAETLQGTRWAIQAKCYGPDQSLTWPDLSTFYGDAIGRTEIDQLLLVTTTDRISPNAKKKLDQSSKPSAIWAGADLLQFSIDSSLESLNEPAITEKYEPRPHQREAIDDAVAHLKENERGQLLMACGTGKTLTGLWIREEMKAQRTVVFVPSIALLRQTWSSWNQHANEPFYSIAICSDAKATSRKEDELVTSLSAAGLPPTTDPDTIAEALDVPSSVVVFSTYQSSEVLETALKKAGRPFDLMVADEAHNTTSAGLTDFTRPLYDNRVPAKRRLFCTATPRIISRKGTKKDGEETYDIHSMDNEDLYGEVAHKLMFSEAIADGLLNDYEVFVVGVDDPEIVGTIEERHYLDVNGTIIDGGYIYGICSYGQLRCLNASTGERIWESQEATTERRRWVSGFMVKNGNRVFITNDRGELIISRLSPAGYEEISRTHLITPTSPPGNRRELRNVNWVHPAYANKHIYTRNDEEIISVSMDAADYD